MNISERVVAEIELKISTGDSGFSSDKMVFLERRQSGECLKVTYL